MQKQADQMMTGSVFSKYAPVNGMRNHCKRMPVAGYNGCKCPFNIFQTYSDCT